jgi:hypothetical protein
MNTDEIISGTTAELATAALEAGAYNIERGALRRLYTPELAQTNYDYQLRETQSDIAVPTSSSSSSPSSSASLFPPFADQGDGAATSTGISLSNTLNLEFLSGDQGVEFDFADTLQANILVNTMSSCGDMNSDGVDDILVTTTNATGHAYVIYGRPSWPVTVNVSNLVWGVDGFQIYGVPTDGAFKSAARAGDLNRDSRQDVVLGMPNATGVGGSADVGAAYVLFGGTFPSAAKAVSVGSKHSCVSLLFESGKALLSSRAGCPLPAHATDFFCMKWICNSCCLAGALLISIRCALFCLATLSCCLDVLMIVGFSLVALL